MSRQGWVSAAKGSSSCCWSHPALLCPLDVLGRRVAFRARLTFGCDLAPGVLSTPLHWETARHRGTRCPLSCSPSTLRAKRFAAKRLYFIHPRSKIQALEEKKMKEKRRVKGEGKQGTDWSPFQVPRSPGRWKLPFDSQAQSHRCPLRSLPSHAQRA